MAQDNVVLFAAREIHQGKWEFPVAHDAQIGLDAAGQKDAGFGLALGDHIQNPRLLREEVKHCRGFLG